MKTSDTLAEISGALAKAQAVVKGAAKDTANPFYKSTYADLASTWDACREAITSNGLAVVQAPSSGDDGAVCVTTRLVHSSGEWMQTTLCCRPAKNDAQGLGSVITYLRRYSLAAMVGVAPEDDDGEGAVGRGKEGQPLGDVVGAPHEKTTKDADWVGPLNKTALKSALRGLHHDIMGTSDNDELDALLAERKAVIEQALEDLPEWITGDGGDKHGVNGAINDMRLQFAGGDNLGAA